MAWNLTPIGIVLENPISSSIVVVTLAVAIILAKLFYTSNQRLFKLQEIIPGPPKLPLFGNTFDLLGPVEEILVKFSKWTREYGPRVLYRVGNYWVVSLSKAQDLEKLLSSTTETQKSTDYDQFIPWLGEGVLVSNGKKWSHRRKMLTPAFHFKILEQFMDVYNEQSKLLVKILKDEFSNKETFDIAPYITRCTLEIICETAMGVVINGQLDRDAEYLQATDRIKQLQLHRSMRPWLESRLIWKTFSYGREEEKLIDILHNFTDKVIRERKREFLENQASKSSESEVPKGKRRLALLDLMFEAQLTGDAFTDEGIREETDTFMFGGHDTTATAAAFTLFHIGNHPEIQEKIHQELDEMFGSDRQRNVSSDDLSRLKYLECCIKESMRLTAPVPMTARTIQNDFELEKGVVLPPETLVVSSLFELHRDAEVYPSPEEYIPERFLPENAVGRHPFAYLPFSAGPRNCIGQKFAMMEEKVLLANIFRNLSIKSTEKLTDLVLIANIILHSKSGINVKINSR